MNKATHKLTYWENRKMTYIGDTRLGLLYNVGGRYDPANQKIEIYLDMLYKASKHYHIKVQDLITETHFHEDMHYALQYCDQDTSNEQYIRKIERIYNRTIIQTLWENSGSKERFEK